MASKQHRKNLSHFLNCNKLDDKTSINIGQICFKPVMNIDGAESIYVVYLQTHVYVTENKVNRRVSFYESH